MLRWYESHLFSHHPHHLIIHTNITCSLFPSSIPHALTNYTPPPFSSLSFPFITLPSLLSSLPCSSLLSSPPFPALPFSPLPSSPLLPSLLFPSLLSLQLPLNPSPYSTQGTVVVGVVVGLDLGLLSPMAILHLAATSKQLAPPSSLTLYL